MDPKIKSALEVLGFHECAKVGKLPKLKEVTKVFHKLAMVHHPDKPGGDGEVFKPITEAYRLVGEFLENVKDDKTDDHFDYEEDVARRMFHQFKFGNVKENMRSFTVHIDNADSHLWTKVLSKHYGDPLDKNCETHYRSSR